MMLVNFERLNALTSGVDSAHRAYRNIVQLLSSAKTKRKLLAVSPMFRAGRLDLNLN